MEKILKILKKISFTIPFLLFFININVVSAEESTNIYFAVSYNSFVFTPYSDNYTYDTLSFSYNNNSFIYNYKNTLNSPYIAYVLYDKTNQLPILVFQRFYAGSSCTMPFAFDIQTNQCKNGDSWVSLSLAETYYAILSTKVEETYLKQIDSTLSARSNNNGIYYLTFNGSHRSSNILRTYVINHSSDFELITSPTDTLYINGVEMPKFQNITPEPEPDPEPEPEEPTIPPYNFNNNKYYVPNYQEGNCVEIIDKDTIRVFTDEFTNFYTDYYINSNYISKTGQVEVDYVKQCSTLEFTDIRYYGNDFPQILIITLVIITFTIGFPYILYKRFRKR